MPVAMKDVMRVLCFVSEKKKMNVPVEPSSSLPLVLSGVLIGARLGGLPGLLFGGLIGGLAAVGMKSKPFKPVHEILMGLSHAHQQKLLGRVQGLIWNLKWMDTVELMALVMRSEKLQRQLEGILVVFFREELHTEVQLGV